MKTLSPERVNTLRATFLTTLTGLAVAMLAACSTPAATPSVSGSPPLIPPAVSSTAPHPDVSPPMTPAGPPPRVTGTVTAGPVCPVERNPPDPSCAPRPVDGAVIVATDSNGQEVGRATTTADGTFQLTVPQTGTFVITGLPVPGLLGVPDPVAVSLTFPGATQHVDLVYDTGIR